MLLDGESIHRLPTKEVATRLGILPQSPIAPEGITVADLVGRGRYPHQRWFRQWTQRRRGRDHRRDGGHRAPSTSPTGPSTSCRAASASGCGSRWRSRRAPTLMLLDEPTTFLDLAHQVEVLDLLVDLNQRDGAHDRARAARPQPGVPLQPPPHRDDATGAIVAEGPPAEVITEALVAEVFGLRCRVRARSGRRHADGGADRPARGRAQPERPDAGFA